MQVGPVHGSILSVGEMKKQGLTTVMGPNGCHVMEAPLTLPDDRIDIVEHNDVCYMKLKGRRNSASTSSSAEVLRVAPLEQVSEPAGEMAIDLGMFYQGVGEQQAGLKEYTRVDLGTKSFRKPDKAGPKWHQVRRRVSLTTAGKLLEDVVVDHAIEHGR